MTNEEQRFDWSGAASRALVEGVTLGPLNIMASLGTGEALASAALAAIIGLLNETAAAKDGRRHVVATVSLV